jgi:7-cyano-7-deazaguanine synthase
MAKHVVVSLSGGMDSSTLLLRCLKEYDTVTAISFDYGQKHRVELDRAQSLVDYINDGYDSEAENIPYLKINYRQIQLNGLADLLNSALVTGGEEVPEGHYAEENMKATVVPNRNKIFAQLHKPLHFQLQKKQVNNVILLWEFMQAITQFIQIVDKNLEMQMMQPLELEIGELKK